MKPEIVTPNDLEGDETTPGIVRRPVFKTETTVMAQSFIEAETTTGWHHHGDRDAYGYMLEGQGVIEYGPEGRESFELRPPLFFHVPAGLVHRETVSPGQDAEVVVNFVGSGPVVVNVDGPESANE